ncbi:MAG: hypothetical protein E7578_05120 [Ruminococcaceae bacterium]|nr:hypothetical protein [Oscillospiraceae bacterium]
MKLFWIGVGMFFLANPVVGVCDYLPDFIGCLLIMYAVRDGAYIIEKLESARRWFMYGALLGIVRTLVSFADIESQHTLPLTLAFVFAVLEMVVYIPAFHELFSGFDYAAMRLGGSKVLSMGKRMGYYTDESGKRQYGEIQDDTTGRLARFSQVFLGIRAVMSVIPELPALELAESENLGEVGAFQFSSIGTLIKLVTVTVALIPGIIFLVRHIRFLHRIKKTGDFVPAVKRELSERFGDLTEIHTCSYMKLLSFVTGVAVVLYMGFYDYQINIVPRYVCACVLAFATILLFAFSKRKIVNLLPIIPTFAAIPLSIKTYALQKDHYELYRIQMMNLFESGNETYYDRNINAIDEEYLIMARWESLEAVVLGAAIVLFLFLYLRLSLSHLKTFRSVSDRYRDEIARSLKIRGGVMLGGAVLSAAYFTAYRYILPYFDSASIVGVGVNILSTVLFIVFATQANKYVYGNLHGA